jgi:hypothetical protein
MQPDLVDRLLHVTAVHWLVHVRSDKRQAILGLRLCGQPLMIGDVSHSSGDRYRDVSDPFQRRIHASMRHVICRDLSR